MSPTTLSVSPTVTVDGRKPNGGVLPKSLIFLCIGTFALRLWGVGYALPYEFTLDEVHEILRALKLGAGAYDWERIGKGGLYYILFLEYGIIYLTYLLLGIVSSPTEFAEMYLRDPTLFYLAGRATNVLLGTATCVVIYHNGARLMDTRTALIAAVIAGTSFVHVTASQVIMVDVGALLAIWSSFLCFIQYSETNLKRWLVAAGSLAGVAIAFKMPGIFGLFLIVVALSANVLPRASRPSLLKDLAILLGSCLLVVSISAPELIGQAGKFKTFFAKIADFSYVQVIQSDISSPRQANKDRSSAKTKEPETNTDEITKLDGMSPWQLGIFRFTKTLVTPSNLPLLILAIIGSGFVIRERRTLGAVLVFSVIAFLIGLEASDRFARHYYLMPVLPIIWLFAARAIDTISGRHRGWTLLLVAMVVCWPIFNILSHNYSRYLPDTRLLTKEWIEEHIPDDAKVLVNWGRHRNAYAPPLRANEASVARAISTLSESPWTERKRGVSYETISVYEQHLLREAANSPSFDMYRLGPDTDVGDLDHYLAECIAYVVVAGYQRSVSRMALLLSELEDDKRAARVFQVSAIRWTIQGPPISIYRLNSDCGS